MYNQGPAIGRINYSFSDPEEQNPSAKPRMAQPLPGSYPNSSSFPLQQYGAPVSPQGPYTQQQPYPPNAGHTGVTVQPTVIMTSRPASNHMSEFLCYSIFNLLFCCFPLGFAAVIYSAATRDANLAGRQDLAIRSSRTALTLNNVALGFGLALYTIATVLLLWVYGVIK
ncbi:synapse differentiation-inducing gene protein 1-like [Megalobrama amblycephala]|uniref:synapse differentiation-inducing gene protein 1-like n=1 Tax=Megalobrama amblycephala TaxID=75352 RepID=UPI002013FA5A|nr:synapse differentiation-inducing gene protein 1-like [Megalobrama amblycephala]